MLAQRNAAAQRRALVPGHKQLLLKDASPYLSSVEAVLQMSKISTKCGTWLGHKQLVAYSSWLITHIEAAAASWNLNEL